MALPSWPTEFSGVWGALTMTASNYNKCCESDSLRPSVIIDALLRGVKDGADILTLSLGGTDGWTEGAGSIVASRIAAKGKIVTVAANNEVCIALPCLHSSSRLIFFLQGNSGSWFTSSPANGIDVISVGSYNTAVPLQTLKIQGATHDPIIYYTVCFHNRRILPNTDACKLRLSPSLSLGLCPFMPHLRTPPSLTTHATPCQPQPPIFLNLSSLFAAALAPS
jgi:hypothetical protein